MSKNPTDTVTEARRDLPAAHDDAGAPTFVPVHLRDAYRTIDVPPSAIEEATRLEARRLDLVQAREIWEFRRAEIQARHTSDYYGRWLRKQRLNANGDPSAWILDELLDEYFLSRQGRRREGDRLLTEDERANVLHQTVLDAAERQIANRVRAKKRAAARIAEETCTICGTVTASTHPRRSGQLQGKQGGGAYVRACDSCAQVSGIIALLTAETPDGPRIATVARWLSTTSTAPTLTEADIDAWLDDPHAIEPVPSGKPTGRPSGILTRIVRAFSS